MITMRRLVFRHLGRQCVIKSLDALDEIVFADRKLFSKIYCIFVVKQIACGIVHRPKADSHYLLTHEYFLYLHNIRVSLLRSQYNTLSPHYHTSPTMEYSLIANSGIQLFTFRIEIDVKDRFKEWYHEWYDAETGQWKLELVHQICTDTGCVYYRKADLIKGGHLPEADIDAIRQEGIKPLKIDDDMCDGVEGEIYSLTFSDKNNCIEQYENRWIPVPYFFRRTRTRFKFGPLNWSRCKLIPAGMSEGGKIYDVLLAFDTYTTYENEGDNENPVFPDKYRTDIDFAVCTNELYLMDYCSPDEKWSFVNSRLMNLAHPGISNLGQIKGTRIRRMAYAASYVYLMSYIANNNLFPEIKLYKDIDVAVRDVDMVIDIGNSRTTALLIEDNSNFNQVRPLRLVDMTNTVAGTENGTAIRSYNEPFDMRLAFRKVAFGNFGSKDSRQFIYPSLVRVGAEANSLIHAASLTPDAAEKLSTYSSPKRYLWDWRPTDEEWRFLVLDGEDEADHILNIPGITDHLRSDGQYAADGTGGLTFHYSRRSLMTFSFLEMLVQAQMQINSTDHRSIRTGLGLEQVPRRVKRVIVTCPTAMSKIEREALINCARDAVKLLACMSGDSEGASRRSEIEIIPANPSFRDEDGTWYYDEATCSQLVYMYGEVGHKYKGCSKEFFNLYGKTEPGDNQPSLTVGSLDIGAGTSDLMISKYSYETGDITSITPDPLFYDSFYFAGDDMLNGLIKNVMLLNEGSAFRTALSHQTSKEYRQSMKNFFGPDHNGQTMADRLLRKDFNIQYNIPLMYHFLELLRTRHKDCTVRYEDVFGEMEPNENVIEGFKEHTGIDIRKISWNFNYAEVSAIVEKEFEPLLKRIASMMYAYSCDIVLLSGRPASLPPVRELFLKYYAVAPNRLILLNNYYVGDWYPFSENTGYITNPKTIVAMGGILGHYASDLSNLNKFVINLDNLKKNLKSTVNYIEASREGQPISYFISPEQPSGELTISRIPTHLNVRQIRLDSYPCRALYTIDFNRHKIADAIRRRALLTDNVTLTDAMVRSLVNKQVDELKRRMPFKLTIERDPDDKEHLSITSIVDRDDRDISDNNIEIHIQSLGADDMYWLDSGAFNF